MRMRVTGGLCAALLVGASGVRGQTTVLQPVLARVVPDTLTRPAPAESASVTQHTVSIDGQLIHY